MDKARRPATDFRGRVVAIVADVLINPRAAIVELDREGPQIAGTAESVFRRRGAGVVSECFTANIRGHAADGAGECNRADAIPGAIRVVLLIDRRHAPLDDRAGNFADLTGAVAGDLVILTAGISDANQFAFIVELPDGPLAVRVSEFIVERQISKGIGNSILRHVRAPDLHKPHDLLGTECHSDFVGSSGLREKWLRAIDPVEAAAIVEGGRRAITLNVRGKSPPRRTPDRRGHGARLHA